MAPSSLVPWVPGLVLSTNDSSSSTLAFIQARTLFASVLGCRPSPILVLVESVRQSVSQLKLPAQCWYHRLLMERTGYFPVQQQAMAAMLGSKRANTANSQTNPLDEPVGGQKSH
ncbi:uncharacterized protein BO95DRAFT_428921 [Aspergillus brunneoviolaceus CBS 621.78]|uniref:Uncharacterized protein n=1 Tax=Aspergillus brunneoviolaceus CBS 621.78 TaxID=1450534 RepID=A0ACD1GIE5_9EURO|nr:hypothetical protein BO95DRAFT_428921 [Aspergillus brunneoviolaceus CBS 621.78]RAH49110.1 hypothetical protein BO95DRAFT_428921 [Aspergillus brunneoviolaceus CBS 621.78]